MKTSIKILALMLMMITSCDMNTRLTTTELTEQVQEHILEKWEELYSEEELDEVELKSFILVHKSDNEYSGVLETIESVSYTHLRAHETS